VAASTNGNNVRVLDNTISVLDSDEHEEDEYKEEDWHYDDDVNLGNTASDYDSDDPKIYSPDGTPYPTKIPFDPDNKHITFNNPVGWLEKYLKLHGIHGNKINGRKQLMKNNSPNGKRDDIWIHARLVLPPNSPKNRDLAVAVLCLRCCQIFKFNSGGNNQVFLRHFKKLHPAVTIERTNAIRARRKLRENEKKEEKNLELAERKLKLEKEKAEFEAQKAASQATPDASTVTFAPGVNNSAMSASQQAQPFLPGGFAFTSGVGAYNPLQPNNTAQVTPGTLPPNPYQPNSILPRAIQMDQGLPPSYIHGGHGIHHAGGRGRSHRGGRNGRGSRRQGHGRFGYEGRGYHY
jgi:hypothetical protein